jgi:hypothetical protein
MGLSCLVAAASVAGGETPSDPHEQFICTSGASKRLVSIYREPGRPGCHVDYVRDGSARTVWSASAKGSYAYCVKKALSLVTTLSKSNYACKPGTGEAPEESSSP